MFALRLIVLLLCFFVAAACGDNASTPSGDAGIDGSAGDSGGDTVAAPDVAAPDTGSGLSSFADLYDKVFVKMGCANGYCHGSVVGKGGLSMLDADTAYADLIEQSRSSHCGGEMRVVPGDASKSVLYTKIAKGVPTCGSKMPPKGAPGLPDEVVDAIKSWIAAGAKR